VRPVIEQAIATASSSTGNSRLRTNSSPSLLLTTHHNLSSWHTWCQRTARLTLKTAGTIDQPRPATVVCYDEAEKEEGDEADEDADEVDGGGGGPGRVVLASQPRWLVVWAAGCARAATSSLESTAGSQQLVARVTAVVLTVAQLGTGNALASDSTLKFSFSVAAELLVRSVVAIGVPIAQF